MSMEFRHRHMHLGRAGKAATQFSTAHVEAGVMNTPNCCVGLTSFLLLVFGPLWAVDKVLVAFQEADDLLYRGLLILMGPSESRGTKRQMMTQQISSGYLTDLPKHI